MKFKNLISVTTNKANKQISFNLKKKQLKKFGLTPEQLLESPINFKQPIKRTEPKKEVELKYGINKRKHSI